MTRTTSSRIAGFTFVLYIALGVAGMALDARVKGGDASGAALEALAQHAVEARASAVLSLGMGFCALVLAATLYALTRDEDDDLARLAMLCRVGEGFVGLAGLPVSLGLLKLATAAAGSAAPDPSVTSTVGIYLNGLSGGGVLVSSILFAAGSTLFSLLFLRARSIPVLLAGLGVVSSVVLVVALIARVAGLLARPLTMVVWMPMLVFELAFAVWLMARGVADRDRSRPARPR